MEKYFGRFLLGSIQDKGKLKILQIDIDPQVCYQTCIFPNLDLVKEKESLYIQY